MLAIDRSSPGILGSSHDGYDASEGTKENCSQTQHSQKQSMRHELPYSQSCQLFGRSMEIPTIQSIRQTHSKSDAGHYINPMVNRTNGRMPDEDDGGSQAGKALQHRTKTNQIQGHESGSANKSDIIGFDDPGPGNIMDCDLHHLIRAEKGDDDDSSRWCSICRNVENGFIQGERDGIFDIGTWNDLKARAGCPSCDDMLSMPSRSGRIKLCNMSCFFGDGPYEPYSHSLSSDMGTNVFLMPLDRVLEPGLKGLLVDPKWFNVARLRKWLAFCDENHGQECHGLPIQHDLVSTRPRYLIDVEQGCLIEPCGDEQYFALSYVWGTQQEAGMATTENIELLKQKHTITIQNETFKLPRTVGDAIILTKVLGERFLWVDRLCIIQNDLDNWHSQIRRMGSIYANAYCTFVASGGSDADHGIPGLSQYSGPRQLLRRLIRFPSLQMIEVDPVAPTWASTYNTRGWTFQELKLSRRAIFFNNDVRWACNQSEWQEDIAAEPEVVEFGPHMRLRGRGPSLLNVEPWPNLAQWATLISSYCRREFSFEEDAGAAFAGVEEILNHSFPGGFCYGMPEFYFDIALLWWPSKAQQRRVSAFDESSYLPSWSFLGWKGGEAHWNGPAFAYEWLTRLPPPRRHLCSTSSILPKVDWIQRGPCGQERRIRNDYHIWKKKQEQQPPKAHEQLGWRRESDNSWTHASIPKFCFRYPVPFGFQTVTDEYRTWSASLPLRSQSTLLIISHAIDGWRNRDGCLCAELVTQMGKWAGILHLNTSEVKDVPLGEKCELVALSCGSVSNDDQYAETWLDEWRLDGRPRASKKYEFYNVMWIRREGTYFVRENVGRVEKSVWDCQELQEVDVELR